MPVVINVVGVAGGEIKVGTGAVVNFVVTTGAVLVVTICAEVGMFA